MNCLTSDLIRFQTIVAHQVATSLGPCKRIHINITSWLDMIEHINLPVSPSTCSAMSIYLPTCQSIHPFGHITNHLSILASALLSIWLSDCLIMYLSIFLSYPLICLSVCLIISWQFLTILSCSSPSIHLSVWPFIHPSLHLYLNMSIYLPDYLTIFQSVCLSVCLII